MVWQDAQTPSPWVTWIPIRFWLGPILSHFIMLSWVQTPFCEPTDRATRNLFAELVPTAERTFSAGTSEWQALIGNADYRHFIVGGRNRHACGLTPEPSNRA